MITRRILSISSDVSLFFSSLVCVCSTRTNDACRHKYFDIFEPNVGRKRKINEIFWGPGARRKSMRESSVCARLSQRWLTSTGMPHIPDLHQSLIMLFNKCLMCQSSSPIQCFVKGNPIFALSFPELFTFCIFSS